MLHTYFWQRYYTPLYLFLIKNVLPVFAVLLLVVLAALWIRFIKNRIYDILHPEQDIQTQKTNTWYKTPAERAAEEERRDIECEKDCEKE